MSSYKLTGRRRYREQKRLLRSSLLVLQVEETFTAWFSEGGSVDSRDHIGWRDATVADLMIIPANVEPLRVVR